MLRHFRRWQFEVPQMEVEFQAQMCVFVGKAFNVWCIFLFLLFVSLEGMSFLLPNSSFPGSLPYLLVLILLLCFFLVTNLIPATQRYISTTLPLVCTVICAIVGWSVHRTVAQMQRNAVDLSLVHTMALVQGQAQAEAELLGYLQEQLSRKLWYRMILIMYVTVDALRLTGTTHNAFYVHVMPVLTIVVTTYCSDVVSQKAIEVVSMAAIITVYTAVSSIHMLMMHRDRFRIDYQLRQQMAQEAELMAAARNGEVAQRQASQKADSMLNHILKNIMADAHGCIDLFLGQQNGSVDGAEGHLHQAQESLERGMRWCKKRQVMVQVNSGNYTPVLAPVNLRKLVDGMMYGREIVVDIPDVTVHIDSLLCEVVLDNAISNAFRHGDCTRGPVSLVVIADVGEERPLHLTFSLTNYVSDGQCLSPDFVAQLAAGHADACSPAKAPALSGHLGLRHMFMAAAAHGMAASLEQVGNLVVFTASLDVDTDDVAVPGATLRPRNPSLPAPLAAFPPGLRILCLDDSDIARRVLLHGLATHAPQASSAAFGATQEDVATFEAAALRGADVLILDQHLDYQGAIVYGTDVARRLRCAGYAGFICVRSANATEEDEAEYRRCGADCMIGKDVPLRETVEVLQRAYEQWPSQSRTQQSLTLSTPEQEPGGSQLGLIALTVDSYL
eukprot:EG_transcript_2547